MSPRAGPARTYWDELIERGEASADGALPGEGGVTRVPSVEAPCCGRRRAADAILDLRHVDGLDADWACSGCKDAILRGPGPWTRSRLLRAVGASDEAVRAAWLRERVRGMEREREDRSEPFDSGQALQAARDELPDSGMPPGSDPPEGRP